MGAIMGILSRVLQFGGTLATGWAVSDWFNESKKAEQQGIEKPKFDGWFKSIIKPFLLILGVGGAAMLLFNRFFQKGR